MVNAYEDSLAAKDSARSEVERLTKELESIDGVFRAYSQWNHLSRFDKLLHLEANLDIQRVRAMKAEAERDELRAKLADAEKRYEQCKQQAEIWAQEARTHQASLFECYAACGVQGKADFNGAQPVRDAIDALNTKLAALQKPLGERPKVRSYPAHGSGFIAYYDPAEATAYMDAQDAKINAQAQEIERLKAAAPPEPVSETGGTK